MDPYNNNTYNDDQEHATDDMPSPVIPSASSKAACWHIVSNIIFVIASCFYLALAGITVESYRFYSNVPASVLYATDDATWWNYYNETNAYDDVVLNATDDVTWSEWYNNTFYPEDDTVFQVNSERETTIVNQYMILYFIAAMGFLVTGTIEFFTSPTIGRQAVYLVFVIAAAFGVASSMMVVADPFLASVFNSVSVHLFAIEAISIIIQSKRAGGSVGLLLWIGHISFVIGTITDMVLSYFYVLDLATLPHVSAQVGAACFWVICSLIYLWNSISQRRELQGHVASGMAKEETGSEEST